LKFFTRRRFHDDSGGNAFDLNRKVLKVAWI
jgi:hypothetical protein